MPRTPRIPGCPVASVQRATCPFRGRDRGGVGGKDGERRNGGAGLVGDVPVHPADKAERGMSASVERAVLAAALDPIITINARGVIQSASDSVRRVFGWSPDELVGRNVNILMPEPHHTAHDGYLSTYRRTGRTNILGRPREFEAVRKSGERFPIELCVSRVEKRAPDEPDARRAGGQGVSEEPLFVGIIRDISAQKRLERETVLLRDLALTIGGTSSIAEARREAMRLIGTAAGWDYGELWAPEGDNLMVAARWVRPASGLERLASDATRTQRGAIREKVEAWSWLVRRAVTAGEAVWCTDLRRRDGQSGGRAKAYRPGLRTAAAVPVVADGSVKKVLLFMSREQRTDELHTLSLLRVAAASLETLIQRKRAEELLRASEARVSSELAAMTGLHELVHRLLAHKQIQPALTEVLDAAVTLTGASAGRVQLLDRATGESSVIARRGRVATAKGRGTVERMVHLVASDGRRLGELLTCYPADARLTERDLRILDLCARQAADFVDRTLAQQQLDGYRHALEQKVEARTRELEQSREKLRMSDRLASIGTLAAGLGHDMNNVLLPVRARLNALRASDKVQTPDRVHVQEIQRSVSYLQQLADGLHFLALDPETEEDARGGGGSTDLHRWWSQVGTLLSKAVPKHVRVGASFPAGLPHAGVPAHGLTQAVLNLVVNAGEAIGHTPGRKRRVGQVRIWAKQGEPLLGAGAGVDAAGGNRRGLWLHIGVTDNGTGMSDDVRRRAFEMFYTTKPRGLGTGLGLALVRKVVEKAGGHVELTSEVGKGTTVLLVLPAAGTTRERGEASERLSAVIALSDGRARAMIGHLLESGGVRVISGERSDVPIRITEPTAAGLAESRTWRRGMPEGQLVLLGRADRRLAASWSALAPVTIDTPNDLEVVRAVINRAVSVVERSAQS